MLPGPGAARRHVEFAGIGLGIGDELGNRLRRKRWIHHHDLCLSGDGCDRRDVAGEIEIELVVKRHIDRAAWSDHDQRMAVGWRTDDHLGADITAGTRPVLDDEWLTKPLRQPLTHQPCDNVILTASGKPDDDAHRARRVGLRPCDARNRRQRGGARGKMQKRSAGKFHHNVTPLFRLNEAMRGTGFWNTRMVAAARHHSGLMPANLITLAHFSVSSAMSLPKSVGDPRSTVPPNSSRALILRSTRPVLISLLSLSTISAGVFLGAPRPHTALAS